jgi:CubicO group peptidase (beta-lactamase class C family)
MATIQNVDKIMTQAVESGAMPGIVVAAATDKGTLFEGAYGKREIGKPQPMTIDTVVWIASMTKAITAAAVMQLVEAGKLALERPAADVVPELAGVRVLEGFDGAGKPRLRAPKRPVSLRHLLTHTAGYAYEMWNP